MNAAKTTALLLLLAAGFLGSSADRAAACAGDGSHSTLCSKTFYAEGECNGLDQIAILEHAWEDRAIEIRGVTIGLSTPAPVPTAYVFAGNSFAADVMAFRLGDGDKTVMFPPGASFAFPGPTGAADLPRVDLHVECPSPAAARLSPAPAPARGLLGRLRDRLLGTQPVPATAANSSPARMPYRAWLIVYYSPRGAAAAVAGH